MFLQRQFAKLLVIVDLTSSYQDAQRASVDRTMKVNRGKLRQLTRAIHHLAPKDVLIVTQAECMLSAGASTTTPCAAGFLDQILQELQEIGAKCNLFEISNGDSMTDALYHHRRQISTRPILLIKPDLLTAERLDHLGDLCDYGIVYGSTLVDHETLEQRPESAAIDPRPHSADVSSLTYSIINNELANCKPSTKRSGCYFLAADFWQTLKTKNNLSEDDDLPTLIDQIPTAAQFLNPTSIAKTARLREPENAEIFEKRSRENPHTQQPEQELAVQP